MPQPIHFSGAPPNPAAPTDPDQTGIGLRAASEQAGGFIYAPLPSGGAIIHLAGVAKPIHLRDKRDVLVWSHGYLAGDQHMRDVARAALDDVMAEVTASAPC